MIQFEIITKFNLKVHKNMEYFTIHELLQSNTAKIRGINNIPDSSDIYDNLQALIENVLDPLRKAYGKPIFVSSGYRCPALNKLVGGSKTSQHVLGQAADIHVKNTLGNKQLYNLVLKLKLPFDQMILEKGTIYNPQWVHISYKRNGGNRGQKLFYNGKTYIKIK